MDLYTIIRTSPDTADGEPIVLRETTTTRLVFKLQLVNNAQDSNAPVKGTFIFQRKGPNDSWEDHNEVPLSRLRAGEWVKVDLKAAEIDKLQRHITAAHRLYERSGLPKGKAHFIRIDLGDDEEADITQLDIGRLLELSRRIGIDAFTDLVEWAVEAGNTRDVLSQLDRLDIDTLQRLNSLVGISSLKAVLQTWEGNQNNSDEEFWQQTLQENAFVLSQVFSFPVLIIRGKAYVGGKVIDNTGGHLVDFLATNPLTRNAVIVEIKTPQTKLLGRKYRADVYSQSEELSGAVTQVLNYRYSLTTDFLSVRRRYEEMFDVFSPHCLVIAGHAGRELDNDDKCQSFELARSNLKDVLVLTYDELFGKVRQLIETLEGVTIQSESST
jgi:hypothetical protein